MQLTLRTAHLIPLTVLGIAKLDNSSLGLSAFRQCNWMESSKFRVVRSLFTIRCKIPYYSILRLSCMSNFAAYLCTMKKFLLNITGILSATFALTVNGRAQCSVDTIPLAFNNGGGCYIDNVVVNSNFISTNSGFQASGNSYQSFAAPYITMRQGEQSWFDLGFVNSSNLTVCVWIDFDNDGVYASTEIAIYQPNWSNSSLFTSVTPPPNTLPDTVHMRIAIQENAAGWGPGTNDACNAPGIGEVEDYSVIIECATPQALMFDQFPIVCHADSVQLTAFSTADIAWYTGSPMTLQHVGQDYFIHTAPSTTDTVVYLQFASPGCFSGWIDSMMITFMPAPVANILGPDTIQSCSVVTISATPGPYYYSWNSGDTGSTITITNGFGGMLSLGVVASNGCYDNDQIYVNIAPNPPATYSHISAGSSFCSNLEVLFSYDSMIAPGSCTWYNYPSNTLVGSGTQFFYILPDTGVYQFMAVVNSVCGTDTLIHTFNAYNGISYDSLYVLNAIQNPNGTYVFCYGNTGTINIVLAGVSGTVQDWIITDTTVGMSLNWNDDATLDLPSQFAQSGHIYTAAAIVLNAYGCTDTTEAVMLSPANTMNFNLSDTAWRCSFPSVFGFGPVNYAVYDILWSTGDTTNMINVNAPMDVTVYVIDHNSGCVTNDTAFIGDASVQAYIFSDTTFACNGYAYFDPSLVQYSTDYWEEYDLNWNMMNNSTNVDYTAYGPNDGYLVFAGYNSHGCYIHDTTYLALNGAFTFSLGPDITTTTTPVTLSGPFGNGQFMYTWAPVVGYNQTIQVSTSGTYSLTVDNGQGCVYQDVIVVNILPMNATQQNAVADINIFPNPANDHVTVQSDVMITSINVYDLGGRLIGTQVCESSQADVMTETLPEGCYVLETVTETGINRSRIVVRH